MPRNPNRHRLQVLAAACLISVALPAGAAWAQKTKTKTPEATAPVVDYKIDIPTIDAVNSSLDEDTIRAILSGNLFDHADELASLTADSITVPEVSVQITSTTGGNTQTVVTTFNDFVLTDIVDGKAASMSIAGTNFDAGEDGNGEMGEFSAANLNIAGILGFYGLVAGSSSTEMETIYTDLSLDGGSFTSDEMSCTVGAMSVAEVKARPLSQPFSEIFGVLQALDANPDDPSPEVIGKALRIYADMFTAFEMTPSSFEGLDCAGTDSNDRTVSFKIAGMNMGAMTPGIYPSFSMDGLDVNVEGDGSIQLGNVTFKETDLTNPIEAIKSAPELLDEAWFEANARSLIPDFGGLSFSGVTIDVPDPETDGGRIKGGLGLFDLTLSDYLNGIPTAVFTKAENLVIHLPEETDDDGLQQLIDLGFQDLDLGFALDLAWNEAEDQIAINEFSLTGANLATAVLAGTIVNATEQLFSLDETETLMASMGLAVSQLKLNIRDEGLADLLVTSIAADQGGDPAAMRPIFAGLAEGTIIGALAGVAEAQKVGAAVSAFVAGKAKSLTIDMTAKDASGIAVLDFIAAEDDPASLIGKVNITAVAK